MEYIYSTKHGNIDSNNDLQSKSFLDLYINKENKSGGNNTNEEGENCSPFLKLIGKLETTPFPFQIYQLQHHFHPIKTSKFLKKPTSMVFKLLPQILILFFQMATN